MAKQKRKPVRFIRVQGRVVPIFDKKKTAIGAGITTLGVGVAAGSAARAGAVEKSSRHVMDTARVRMENFRSLRQRRRMTNVMTGRSVTFSTKGVGGSFRLQEAALNKSLKEAGKAIRMRQKSRKLFTKGRFISAGIIGVGVERLVEGTGIEETRFGNQFTSETAGVASAIVSDVVSNRFFQKSSVGSSLRKGFKADSLKGFSKIKSATKGLAIGALKRKIGFR